MIDHVKNDNAQKRYKSPNYNQHEGSRTPKWIIEIDETLITNLEGKNKKNLLVMGFKTI